MCAPALPLVIGASALLGAGTAAYTASKQAGAQKRASAAAESSAAREAQQAERQFNKANQKTPDLAAMLGANRQGAQGGVGSTFLTGVGGAAPGMLGRTSLLGG